MLRGNATKIDALLMREYLHRGQRGARARPGRGVAGGYTAMFQQGVARDVLHVDVTSLYPSLMLGAGIVARLRPAGRLPPPCSATSASSASRPSGWPARRPRRRTGCS